MREIELRRIIQKWRTRLEAALLAIVNGRRDKEKPRVERALIRQDGLALLNLRVWSMRYGLDPEFVLEAVLDWNDRMRRRSFKIERSVVILTVTSGALGGLKARESVEEAARRAYPNGENWKMLASERTQASRLPSVSLDPEAYTTAMERRRRAREKQKAQHTRRAYRREGRPA